MVEPVRIDVRDALALHAKLLSRDGGATGIRDKALLESALARPRQLFAYKEATELVSLAASYTFGIVRNHPFVDGNKRVGFLTGVLFLELNGMKFIAEEEAAAHAVLELAAGTLDEQEYASFLRANVAS